MYKKLTMKKIILIITITTCILMSCKKTNTTPTNKETTQISLAKYGAGVIDIDGNKYKTVIIGTQEWMGENLNVSKYNDGETIPNAIDSLIWAKIESGAWCNYNNNDSLGVIYGKLYTWYAVDTKKVCPVGWHVPSDLEWTKLTDYLGGDSVAGGKLKEIGNIHWKPKNIGATNSSLFKALPGGYRDNEYFHDISKFGFWWSSTDIINPPGTKGGNQYWFRFISSEYIGIAKENETEPSYGKSIRCLKD
jgi:uncharacterized protein (TIGR02145 family)